MKKLIFVRRCSQLFFLGLLIYILWSTTYPLRGIISPQIIFKIDPLIMFFTAVSERILLPGLISSVFMIVLSLLLGRFFCGWVCPLGTLIDGAGSLEKKKKILDDSQNRRLVKPKFVLIFVFSIFAILGIQAVWTFDPLVLVARFISLSVIPTVTLGIDKFFSFSIQKFELYGGFYDFYRQLKASFLGVKVYYFANSLITFIFCILILGASVILSRMWCRMLCPLGALYAFMARFSLLERKTDECINCGKCRQGCRMGAIKEDFSYEKTECILCMDCVYECPEDNTCFGWRKKAAKNKLADNKGLSRREFIFLIVSSFSFLGLKGKEKRQGLNQNVIRPPAALHEESFVNTCVRCGNCMKVCITNGLQPVLLESGWQGIWTPQLVPEIGYCEYNCTLCGQVCPTKAIPPVSLEEKHNTIMGTAKVDRSICNTWAYDKNCLVCEEHCPVADKAIKISELVINGQKILRPVVDPDLCIGCGICQNKCPIRPKRAIRVYT